MAGICSWLQYQDCSPRLNDLLHHRVPSTGAWFLDSADFAALKSGSKRALWLQGKAGCGKSTLIAGAIQDLRAYCSWQDPQPLVLQHFFDATNGSHYRNLRALLASLLCQLAQFSDKSLSVLLGICEDHMSGNSQPSLDTMQHQLDSLLDNLSGHAFVVVDALDEADDTDIIKLLEHLKTRPDVRLLLSSRGEVLFCDPLRGLCDRTIFIWDGLVKGDIGTVIQGAFNQGGPLVRMATNDIDLTREALETGADGSFRWTLLQIQALSSIAGISRKVRQKLKILPKTLSEAYEQCLQAIQPEDRADVRILLTWLLMSYEPLSPRDFALLLSFDYSERLPVFDDSLQPSAIDTLALVGSTFVAVRGNTVRFAHASVRDFLLALPPTSEFHVDAGLAYALMARTGVAYISASSPLKLYSHLSADWVRYVDMAGSFHYDELEPDITLALSNAPRTPDLDFILRRALHLAAIKGHVQLVKLLYDKGADVDMTSNWTDATALSEALQHNQHEVSLLLIELGASPTSRFGKSALDIAIEREHQDIVRAMINRYSVDVDVWSHISGSALQVAADRGHYDIAALLISRGADVSADEKFPSDTALNCAVKRGYEDIIKLLLDQQGSNIDTYDKYNRTALHTAAMCGRHDIASLLIARGADLEARTDKGQCPLHLAALNGEESVAKLLLDQPGVDIEARDDDEWTALHYAARRDNHVGVASLLIGRGANVNARGNGSLTPLHAAVRDVFCTFESDRDRIVQLLLDSGADIEARESISRATPLDLASEAGSIRCIRMLCERGAKKEGRDDWGRTPLYRAAACARKKAVKALLKLGADARTHAYDGTSPLNVIGRKTRRKDAEIEERIRAMLLRAGATEDAPEVVGPTVQKGDGGEPKGDQREGDWSGGDWSGGDWSGGDWSGGDWSGGDSSEGDTSEGSSSEGDEGDSNKETSGNKDYIA